MAVTQLHFEFFFFFTESDRQSTENNNGIFFEFSKTFQSLIIPLQVLSGSLVFHLNKTKKMLNQCSTYFVYIFIFTSETRISVKLWNYPVRVKNSWVILHPLALFFLVSWNSNQEVWLLLTPLSARGDINPFTYSPFQCLTWSWTSNPFIFRIINFRTLQNWNFTTFSNVYSFLNWPLFQ